MITNGEKYCSLCKTTRTIQEFYKDKYRLDGLCNWCKSCRQKYNKNRTEYHSHRHREVRYGVTLEMYNDLLEKQNGRCAICCRKESKIQAGRILTLSVDHNHRTGQIRGLLCDRCNHLLGFFEGVDPSSVIEYLEKNDVTYARG